MSNQDSGEFSPEKFENAKGYIQKAVVEKMKQSGIWDNFYQSGKQLILVKRNVSFFSYNGLADAYKALRANYGSHADEKFREHLDRIAENIINQMNDELGDRTTKEVQDILNQYEN